MLNSLLKLNLFKLYQLWLILLLDIFIGALAIFIYVYDIIESSVLFVVLAVFVFIVMGSVFQEMFNRLFNSKQQKKRNNPKAYQLTSIEDIEKSLMKYNVSKTKMDFGYSYLFIKDKTAYKVLVILNSEIYFNNIKKDIKNTNQTNNKLSKCESFIGFEIFNSNSELIIEKTKDYTFQSNKFYYAGLYYDKENHLLVQSNYETPEDYHAEKYDTMLTILGIKKD